MEGAQSFPPNGSFHTNGAAGGPDRVTWTPRTEQRPIPGTDLEPARLRLPQTWAEIIETLQPGVSPADLSPEAFASYLQRKDKYSQTALGPYQPPSPDVVLGWDGEGRSMFFDTTTGEPLYTQELTEPAGLSDWQLAMLGSRARDYSIVVGYDTGGVHPLPPGQPPDSAQPPPQSE